MTEQTNPHPLTPIEQAARTAEVIGVPFSIYWNINSGVRERVENAVQYFESRTG